MRKIFILIPSWSSAGPVKGAIALANGMVRSCKVTLVAVKPGPGTDSPLDENVEMLSLANLSGGWAGKLREYHRILAKAGGREKVGSISMCFSADLINRFCRAKAFTCASVRGNLHKNYKYDYGAPGWVLSFFHMCILRGFDRVTALSSSMAHQLTKYLGRVPEVIGNFVDEAALEPYRSIYAPGAGVRLVFVGNLSRRKKPDLMVNAMGALWPSAHLDIIGDGVLRLDLEKIVKKNNLRKQISLHGHLVNPLPLVAKADVLVLPSASEGISRAALEALYLGVPCVLRDVDGNRELIRPGHNGTLIKRNEDLPGAIRAAVAIRNGTVGQTRESLLPKVFSQEYAVSRYIRMMKIGNEL